MGHPQLHFKPDSKGRLKAKLNLQTRRKPSLVNSSTDWVTKIFIERIAIRSKTQDDRRDFTNLFNGYLFSTFINLWPTTYSSCESCSSSQFAYEFEVDHHLANICSFDQINNVTCIALVLLVSHPARWARLSNHGVMWWYPTVRTCSGPF